MSPCAHAHLCVCTWASMCVCAHLSTHAGTHTQNTGMGVEEEALLGFPRPHPAPQGRSKVGPLTTLQPRWRDPRMGPLVWKRKMRVKNRAPSAARVQGRESRWPCGLSCGGDGKTQGRRIECSRGETPQRGTRRDRPSDPLPCGSGQVI